MKTLEFKEVKKLPWKITARKMTEFDPRNFPFKIHAISVYYAMVKCILVLKLFSNTSYANIDIASEFFNIVLHLNLLVPFKYGSIFSLLTVFLESS